MSKDLNTLHIYTRVSSKVQDTDGTSLKTQKDLGKKKSKELGLAPVFYEEGAKSSNNDTFANRPEMMRLLGEIEKGRVKHLFVYNNDRLSRNPETSHQIKMLLIKHDVILYTKDGKYSFTSPTDLMMKTVLDAVATYDNQTRRERSRLGKINTVKQGYWYGAPPPYGYKTVDRKLQLDPYESKWVKKIFNWYRRGKQVIWIKNELDKNGVFARRGKLFTTGSILRLMKNTHYVGYYYWTDGGQNNIDDTGS